MDVWASRRSPNALRGYKERQESLFKNLAGEVPFWNLGRGSPLETLTRTNRRLSLFVATVLAQQFHHVIVALLRCHSQGRHAVVVLGIDIGFVIQQELHNVLVENPVGLP